MQLYFYLINFKILKLFSGPRGLKSWVWIQNTDMDAQGSRIVSGGKPALQSTLGSRIVSEEEPAAQSTLDSRIVSGEDLLHRVL